MLSSTPRTGRLVIVCAVAAGRTSNASTSSAPVIVLASAAARPRTIANPVDTTRFGTPAASATSGSIETNSSGRAASATSASATAAITESTDLPGGDAEERAEQQVVDANRAPV